jgi:hypothetical protein
MSTRSILLRTLCAAMLAATAVNSSADNGVIVSVFGKSKNVDGSVGTIMRGSMVKYTLTGTSVGGPTTIFDYPQGGLADYPVISLDGQHIAFWRWGVSQVKSGANLTWVQRPGPLPNPNWLPDTNWLSVMDIDGGNLKNLLIVDVIGLNGNEEHIAALDWPSGDWIYYEKPGFTWEIWRVNYKNPLLNEFVVKFVRDPSYFFGPSGNPTDSEYAPFFRRFSMSADARFAGGQLCPYTNTSIFNFPPVGGDVNNPLSHNQGTGGCNTIMSVSGARVAHYLYGNHETTYFKTYNGITATDDGSQGVQGGSERIRWAANSDNWITQNYSSGLSDDGYDRWADMVVHNVKTNQNVFHTNNQAAGNGWCNDAGEVWISGAPNPESYMDRNGNWVAVPPVVPRDLTAPSTPANPQAQALGAHAVKLTWGASTDAESGVFCYIIYRNGTQVGTSPTLSYSDSGLSENTAYAYTVSAINRGNTESAKASASITTPIAAQGATIVSVDADNGPTSLIVTFDEPLDQATAQTAGNYTLSGGTVTGAALSSDGRKATLTTGSMTAGTSHILTVRNVLDKAAPAHAGSATAAFTYRGLAHGLVYETYNASCGYSVVPPFTGTPVKTGVVRNFDLSNRGTSCGIRFKGYLSIPVSGAYEIKLSSFYNNCLKIDGDTAISATDNYEAITKMAIKTLAAGMHTINLDLSTPEATLWVFAWIAGPDGMQRRIPDNMLFHSADGTPVVNAKISEPSLKSGNMITIGQTASRVNVRIAAPGRHALAIVAPNGSVVRSLSGTQTGLCTIPVGNLARGVYFVKVVAQGKTIVRLLSLR